MRKFIIVVVLSFFASTFFPLASWTADQQLLGNCAGGREGLEELGIRPEVVLTTDFAANVSGGVSRRGTILNNLDISMELDTQKAGWWRDGTFFVFILSNTFYEEYLSHLVGDTQITSNIEAEEAVRLYEAWYEQQFFGGDFSVLVGLHDYNSEFDVLEYSSLFINSSFGIQATISQVGPSIFPNTSLAARLRVNPSDNSYTQVALYDGVSGDPDHSSRTDIRFATGDGIFLGVEGGVSDGIVGEEGYYKVGLGGWLHTAEVEHFDGTESSDNNGIYLIAEKTFYAEDGGGEGLGLFCEIGLAGSVNQVDFYWSMGGYYVGLLPGRSADTFGMALASARNNSEYMAFVRESGGEIKHNETVLEFTYRAEILPWLALQPDIQYVINPSMDPGLANALVTTLRMEVVF